VDAPGWRVSLILHDLHVLACKFYWETTKTTCKNNILFIAAKPRGALESAGVLPAEKEVVFISCYGCFHLQNLSAFIFPCNARAAHYTAVKNRQ